jgi:hypothetical protein
MFWARFWYRLLSARSTRYQKRAQNMGTKFSPFLHQFSYFSQAEVVWQWSRFLFKRAAAIGKKPLLLNLDETAVPVVFTSVKGTVMVHNGPAAWRCLPRQKATKADTRMYFTHVGIICSDSELQPLLPQVIFVGAAVLSAAQFRALQAELPNNVYVKRMPKGWNNAEQHRVIIRMLGLTLAPFLAHVQPIFTFDAAPLHLTAEVLAEIQAARLWFMLVPAKLTWLLQPLDTHVFFKYKLFLKRKFAEGGMGGTSVHKAKSMIILVVQAIRYVMQAHRWEVAFAQNGLWSDQSRLSSLIRRTLQMDGNPCVPDARPTAAMIRSCWPRNRTFHEDVVMAMIPVEADPHLAAHALPDPVQGPGEAAEVAPYSSATGVPAAMVVSSSSASGSHALVPAVAKAPVPVPSFRLRSKTSLL